MIIYMNEDYVDVMLFILKYILNVSVFVFKMCGVFFEGVYYIDGDNVWFVFFEDVCLLVKYVCE